MTTGQGCGLSIKGDLERDNPSLVNFLTENGRGARPGLQFARELHPHPARMLRETALNLAIVSWHNGPKDKLIIPYASGPKQTVTKQAVAEQAVAKRAAAEQTATKPAATKQTASSGPREVLRSVTR